MYAFFLLSWTALEGILRICLAKQGLVDGAHRSRSPAHGALDHNDPNCGAVHLHVVLGWILSPLAGCRRVVGKLPQQTAARNSSDSLG